MIIDIHGHYTTEPPAFHAFRDKQLAGLADSARKPTTTDLGISDEVLKKSVEPQLKFQTERGGDLTIFSPRAGGMAHHVGTEAISRQWSMLCNDIIHRICTLLPDNFVGVGQLPQSPGVPPKNCIPELERIVKELGFVGVNLNPDPSGGYWTDPPMTDKYWYPNFHHTGAHYINGDTSVFMQLIQGNLFKDFPTLRLVIPHGGGAVPYHWGRYRGLCQDMGKPPLAEYLLKNVYFDTCVYHLPGMELLAKVIPADNILFASEMVGAVRGIDPNTGHYYDDTKKYVDQLKGLSEPDRRKIFEGNARRVYPKLDAILKKRGK
jgi:4-oxalmesaconate hydratase